jgi:pimeloyl-ACP methyl ester carboxylesterase
MRLRGTIDHWDPAFIEVLSDKRDVIVFDNAGVGLSSGTVPPAIATMADHALEFADALGLPAIDLLGWSMGGFVAQAVALKRPELVRRLIIAGSNPGKVPGTRPSPAKVWQVASKPANDDEDFLYRTWWWGPRGNGPPPCRSDTAGSGYRRDWRRVPVTHPAYSWKAPFLFRFSFLIAG